MGTKRRIIVCEDDPITQRYIEKITRLIPDTEYHGFSNVGTALLAAESLRPALVIMDHHLPGASGSDAVARLRKTAWGRDVRVLVYSGADVREQALENGADSYIAKPASAEQLLKRIESLLSA